MQKRVRKIANFFAFNILFFALYLNFIDRDRSQLNDQQVHPQTAAFGANVLGTPLEKHTAIQVASIK
ncbi:MAG: hypothetical protein EOO05_05815 [Chitinophagaceae bacterium]|nr:MAG: hypothetical protein EOO05_05815 [Chitinophagaceae bacterium]